MKLRRHKARAARSALSGAVILSVAAAGSAMAAAAQGKQLATDSGAPFTVASDEGTFRLRLPWPRSAEDMPVVQMPQGSTRLVLRVPAGALGERPQAPELGAAQGPVRSLTVQMAGQEGLIIMALREPTRYEMTRTGDGWMLELRASAVVAAAPAVSTRGPATSSLPNPAVASRSPPAAREPPRAETLLLDVIVNGQRLREVVQADRLPGGHVALPRVAWLEARLKPLQAAVSLSGGVEGFELDAVPGLAYAVDRRRQVLDVTAPPQAFLSQSIDADDATSAAPTRPQPGILLNYDMVAAAQGGGPLSGGANLEGIFFSEWGSLAASALAAFDDGRRRVRRLDTFWQMDLPQRMETLVVGDTIGSAGAWSRPVRFGGLRWGRDFSLRPGFVTVPQPSMAGSAALASTVEVLVDNQQRLRRGVPPGPFELRDIPVATGAGELNLVVRDLLGRETVVRQSYYASPRLLAPGLNDYSLEAGWLRTGYGGDRDRYGDAFAAATLRRGLSAAVTGEVRVELQRERRAAGVELAGLIGTWAVARAAYARSASDQDGGGRWLLGIERQGYSGGASLQLERFDSGFEQFAQAPGEMRPRDRVLANVSGRLWGRLAGGLSYTRQTSWNAAPLALLGASLSMPLPGRFSLSLAVSRALAGEGEWRAGLTLSRPIGDEVFATSSVNRDERGRVALEAHAASTVPAGLGTAWRVAASNKESGTVSGGVQWNTPFAESTAEIEAGRESGAAVRAGARGSLGWLGGLGFASRPIGRGAFAVVRVGDEAGVPVLRSHQVVTRTNGQGLALVPGLLPYQANTIEIDSSEMALDAEVSQTRVDVVPYARSGVTVDFGARRSRSALVELVLEDGSPVPAGAAVRLGAGSATFVAARRGEVYMTGLEPSNKVEVTWPGGKCSANFALPVSAQALPRLGPLRCSGGPA